MSRRLIKDDTNIQNIVTTGAGTGSQNIVLSGVSQGDIIQAYKGIFENELNVANFVFTRNSISLSNLNEPGAQIGISAPTINLNAGNIVLNSDQNSSNTDIESSRFRLSTPIIYLSNQPSDGDIGLVFQYFDTNLGTNTQVGFLGFNSKDKKFRLYSSTNRSIENILENNAYLTREQYIGLTGGEFNPVQNEATIDYLGDLQLRSIEALNAKIANELLVDALNVGNGSLIIDKLGTIDMSGNLNINNGIFTVDALTGDTYVSGRLDLASNFSVNTNKFIVNSFSGNTTVAGILTSQNDLIVGLQKMVVKAATGNTNIQGTLDVSNNLTVGSLYNVQALTGNTFIGGNLDVSKNFNINNKFLVNGNTGNTAIFGTLDISGNFSVNDNFEVDASGNLVINDHYFVDASGNVFQNGYFSINDLFIVDPSGNTNIRSNLNLSQNFSLNDLFVIDPSGNTSIYGTLDISNNFIVDTSGNTTLYGILDISKNFIVDPYGNTIINGNLDVSGNFSINDIFKINASTGITTFAGTVNTESDLIVGNNKMIVRAATGNTSIYGTLDVSKNFIVDPSGNTSIYGTFDVSNNFIVDPSGNTSIYGTTNLYNDLSVNNKFIVDANTGYTQIYDSLDISKNLSVDGTLDVSGNTFINGTLDICNNLIVKGYAQIYGTLDVSNNLSINNKFIVDAPTGNTSIQGSLAVYNNTILQTLDVSLNTSIYGTLDVSNNFIVDPLGNVQVKGNLDVNSVLSVDVSKGTVSINTTDARYPLNVNGSINITGEYLINDVPIIDASGNFNINGLFIVNNDTGNTFVGGSLDISKNVVIGGTLDVSENTIIGNNTLIVDTSNNTVSINTTDNRYPLNVNGDINITGKYLVNGSPLADAIPVGTIIPYASDIVPQNWLKCDGSEVSRTEYVDLFNAIGTQYGAGDETTTFNLPDMRGRDIIGSGQGPGLTNREIGSMGGEETHRLTENELPSHSHDVLVTTSVVGGEFSSAGVTTNLITGDRGGIYKSDTSDNKLLVKETGNNDPMNVMHPYTVCNYIIKVKPIHTLYEVPYNHWTRKTNNNLYYTGGNVGIGTTSPEHTLHVQGDIYQSENNITTLQSTNVNGFFKIDIKNVQEVNHGLAFDVSTGSNFSVELDPSNNMINFSFVNVTTQNIGQTGEIFIFERGFNRSIKFDAKIKFVKFKKPTTLPSGSELEPTMCKISYTIVKTTVIACDFEIFDN